MISHPIILFDGYCHLCNGTVDFLLRIDVRRRFRFASLQSETGKKLTEIFNVPPETDSVILILQKNIYYESDAVFKIAEVLRWPWKGVVLFRIFPRKWSDGIYRWIARNRYKWFGRRKTCRLPSGEERRLFVKPEDLKF